MKFNCYDCSYHKESLDICCDKIGGNCEWYGYCEDAFVEDTPPKYDNKSKRTKRERDKSYKKKLKYLANITYNWYPSSAIYVDEKYDRESRRYIPIDKPYYKRLYRGNHKGNRYKFYKKQANKAVRRYKGIISNGCSYKKIYDYWWSVD